MVEHGELGLCHVPLTSWHGPFFLGPVQDQEQQLHGGVVGREVVSCSHGPAQLGVQFLDGVGRVDQPPDVVGKGVERDHLAPDRSEEHTSELQSLMRISYAVFCLKKKKKRQTAQKQ